MSSEHDNKDKPKPKELSAEYSSFASIDVVKVGDPTAPIKVPKGLEEPLKRRLSLENIVNPPLPSAQQKESLAGMGLAVEGGLLVRSQGGNKESAPAENQGSATETQQHRQ